MDTERERGGKHGPETQTKCYRLYARLQAQVRAGWMRTGPHAPFFPSGAGRGGSAPAPADDGGSTACRLREGTDTRAL